ncbi:MAG: hypothetical protein WCS87_00490 [Methylococcaceae bacterium]
MTSPQGLTLAARRKYPPKIRLVPTLRRGNSSGNAPALRDAGASLSAFPTPERGNDRVLPGYVLVGPYPGVRLP